MFHNEVGERIHGELSQVVLAQIAGHLHEVLVPVGKLIHIDGAVLLHEPTLLAGHECILDDDLVQLVNVHLRVFHDVHIAEATGAVLDGEQRVEYEGILGVIIEASIGVAGIILGCIQHLVRHELAVVENLTAAVPCLVVPVHHSALVAHIDVLIVDVLLHIEGVAGQLAFEEGILSLQQILVHQFHGEHIAALLDILDASLPEHIQQVDLLDVDVAKAVLQTIVPEDAVAASALLQLVPCSVIVGLLELVALKDHRHDLTQLLGMRFVALLTRQHIGFRVVVHEVSVLVGKAVEKPRRGGSGIILVAGLLRTNDLPVSDLVPTLVLYDPALQRCFGIFVLLQDLLCLLHLLLADLSNAADRLCSCGQIHDAAISCGLAISEAFRLNALSELRSHGLIDGVSILVEFHSLPPHILMKLYLSYSAFF